MASPLFSIDADSGNQGYQASNSQVLNIKLRNPAGVRSVLFQVYSTIIDPALGVVANPPRASSGAPILTIVGATSGQAVSPVTPDGEVTIAMPVSGGHSW